MSPYVIKEIFATIQGEGCNAGTPMTFIRFARCNLACSKLREGFDCDTDFAHGDIMPLGEAWAAVDALPPAEWVLFTGGEPALQLDRWMIEAAHIRGRKVAIETNGTRPLLNGIDWVCCSPKPTHRLAIHEADEVKFVIPAGGGLPNVDGLTSDHFLLSPAADGEVIDPAALDTCIKLVLANPTWRLSCQQHKWWGVR